MTIGKLSRVVKDQNRRTAFRPEPLPRRSKVTCQNIRFADPIVPKESIGGLGISPVLARPRSGRAYSARQLLQQLSQSFAVAGIRKLASHQLIVYPPIRSRRICRWSVLNAARQPLGLHGSYCATDFLSAKVTDLRRNIQHQYSKEFNLWVIERQPVRLPPIARHEETANASCTARIPSN